MPVWPMRKLTQCAKLPLKPVWNLLRRYLEAKDGLKPNCYYHASDGEGPLGRRQVKVLWAMDAEMRLTVPNLSGSYHGLLRKQWETHGLGRRCLLVSETSDVRRCFEEAYPDTAFVCTDYYTNLRADNPCDVVWNVYEEAPAQLEPGSFDSVICQAMLEHIMDPAGAMCRFCRLTAPGGMVYVHTHTPGYPYHAYPRDYVRFWPDWFRDIETVVPHLRLVEMVCLGGSAFATYQREGNGAQTIGPTSSASHRRPAQGLARRQSTP